MLLGHALRRDGQPTPLRRVLKGGEISHDSRHCLSDQSELEATPGEIAVEAPALNLWFVLGKRTQLLRGRRVDQNRLINSLVLHHLRDRRFNQVPRNSAARELSLYPASTESPTDGTGSRERACECSVIEEAELAEPFERLPYPFGAVLPRS